MKKLSFSCIILLVLFTISCSRQVIYTPLGNDYSPISASESVEIYLTSKPNFRTEQIGVAKIFGFLDEEAVTLLKQKARSKGGNILILTELGINPSGIEFRTFEIVRKASK